jgi:hypothetical protein
VETRSLELPQTFDVALSFAGPQRPLAETLAKKVTDAGFVPFYDDFYPEHLWGKNLVEFFDGIYRTRSRYCVMLISEDYLNREWTILERQSAQARALKEKGQDYILPIQVGETPVEVPGLTTTGHLPLGKYSIEQVGDMLVARLRQ